MKTRAAKVLIIIAGLLCIAQTEPNPDVGSVQVGDVSVPVRIEFKIAEALTGSSFKLDVIFTGSNVGELKIDTFAVQETNSTTLNPPVTIQVERSHTVPMKETPTILRKVNNCRVTVADNAVAQIYRIKMTLSYPDERVDPTYFDLEVWPRTATKGRVTVEKIERLPLVFRTNVINKFNLPVRNDFDSYTIHVKEVVLSSEPPGLIDAKLKRDVKISAEQTENVPIEALAFTPDAIDLIKGFSEEPRLLVKVTYQDDYGRSVPDLRQSIPIKIIPNNVILFAAIIVGVLVGTFVRFYLEFLAHKRQLKRSEVLRFVLYTTIFGLIVAAIALAGQIEIKALDTPMGSYDRPLVMFIIGLAGAIGGVQIIVAWYNSLRPKTKEESPDAQTTNSQLK
ncbi:MAG: hypothetical protein H7Z16_17585 [Pyrinomonadaceae bacterium]|nr:hypothetical protein [Pyrinomonadaceae bacterium]